MRGRTPSKRWWNRFSRHWPGGIIICEKVEPATCSAGARRPEPFENRFSPSLKHVSRMEHRGPSNSRGSRKASTRVTGPRTPECIFHPAYNIKGITYRGVGGFLRFVDGSGRGGGGPLLLISNRREPGYYSRENEGICLVASHKFILTSGVSMHICSHKYHGIRRVSACLGKSRGRAGRL